MRMQSPLTMIIGSMSFFFFTPLTMSAGSVGIWGNKRTLKLTFNKLPEKCQNTCIECLSFDKARIARNFEGERNYWSYSLMDVNLRWKNYFISSSTHYRNQPKHQCNLLMELCKEHRQRGCTFWFKKTDSVCLEEMCKEKTPEEIDDICKHTGVAELLNLPCF